VTGKLPKPIQNDFDTIVIDILTRYSIDNRSVQKFIQAVAEHTRSVTRMPRLLKANKTSSNTTNSDIDNKTKDNVEKPSFGTRLTSYANTFNREGLLGVFFEYLKNKKQDKIYKDQKTDTPTKVYKTDTTTNNNFVKEKETQIYQLEKTITKLNNVLQTIADKRGNLGIAKDVVNHYKDRAPYTPVLQTTSTSYTTSPQNTFNSNNFQGKETTGNIPNIKNDQPATPFVDTEGTQAQQQNVFRKFTVTLGGIDENGESDLIRILRSVFEDLSITGARQDPKEMAALLKGLQGDQNNDSFSSPLLDIFLAKKLLESLPFWPGGGKDKKKQPPKKDKKKQPPKKTDPRKKGPKGGRPSVKPVPAPPIPAPTPSKPKPAPPGPATPKPKPKGPRPPLRGPGGFLGSLMLFGGAMAVGEAGAAMATGESEEFVQGIAENAQESSTFDNILAGLSTMGLHPGVSLIGGMEQLIVQTAENEAQEQINEAKSKELNLRSDKLKAMKEAGFKDMDTFDAFLYGYKNVEKFKQDRIQGALDTSKMQDWHQYLPKATTPTSPVTPVTPSAPSLDDRKPTPSIDLKPSPFSGSLADKSGGKSFDTTKGSPVLGKGSVTSSVPLTPDLAKISSPIPPSITETQNITNNNVDNKSLSDIAANTEKTNKSIGMLSEALFTLAKSTVQNGSKGNTILINGNNGQVKEYTSTANLAANNNNRINTTRREIKAAIAGTA
jgi:hypothetical protein